MWGILFLYFSYCLIQLTHIFAFKILSDHQGKIYWKNIFNIFITAFLMTIVNISSYSTLNSILSIIYIFILYYLIYRKSLKETIYYGFIIWLTGMLIDVSIMLKNTFISLEGINVTLIRILDTFLMIMLMLMFVSFKPLKKALRNLYNKVKKINFSYMKVIYVIAIILSLGFTLMENIINNSVSISLILLTILAIPLIILYINKEYINFSLNQTEKQLIKNNEFYIDQMNDYRILKHNIIHQLNGIKSVANNKTIELIDDIIKDYNENFHATSNLSKMPVGINGLVNEKIVNFNDKKLRLGIDNKIESSVFENLTPRSYNLLCESLGILLDNALEASSKSEEKILMIDMSETEYVYSAKIINTFSNTLDLERLGNINYTTKATGHGIGLFSLFGRRKLKIKTSIINNLFQNEILIEKKK